MRIVKKKEEKPVMTKEEYEEFMKKIKSYDDWLNDPNRSYKNSPLRIKMSEEERIQDEIYRKKIERRNEKIHNFFTTIRDIILTPLAPIFAILATISKLAMYIGAVTFLFACYEIYKSVKIGDGILEGMMSEWKLIIFPFIAVFLYYFFEHIAEYCDIHRVC